MTLDLAQKPTADTHRAFVLKPGEHLIWRGLRFEVTKVATLVPGYDQVVLHPLSRTGLDLSVPATDLIDALPAA